MAKSSDDPRAELLPGTLEMLILRTLTAGDLHGYGIARHIEQTSNGVLRIEQGSLYPALERLLKNGWAKARWDRSPSGRRARYYTITPSGQARLDRKVAEYEHVVRAIGRVISEA
ncbi:MAG TPA: PadR family transcriptional regulator [Candidatus Limnocylindrales bacterium]|nr:PadR family transcriptional regulator [Candidatus Limnocylindrales bacterium]